MKQKIMVFFIVFFLMLISFTCKKNIKEEQIIEPKEEIKQVNLLHNDKIIDLELEEYIIGVVACEMPASFDYEALKAMSVAARTFALYKMKSNKKYDLTSTKNDQCYITTSKMKSNWKDNFNKNYNKIKDAVYETKNEYMTYNDDVIISFYFSISNGYTENCEDVFVQKLDYLKSVDSSWDKEYSYKEKSITIPTKDFLNKLGIKDNKITNIDIKRYNTNRIKTIKINNKSFKGTNFRTLLNLRSTDIEIKYDLNNVYIKTKGYGHGVGMSQYGANYMAKQGYSYEDILKHYYQGIEITNKI